MGVCEKTVNETRIEGSSEPILLEETKNISHMENYICKIIIGDKIGTGFFCKIEFNNKKIPVLMTNLHVINNEFLERNEYLKVYIKNDYHIININKNSKIYSSQRYDLMIIKLNKDNKDIKN